MTAQGRLVNIPPVAVKRAWDLVEDLTFTRLTTAPKVGAATVSRAVGVTTTALAAWEHGEYLPGLAAFIAWANVLGYDVALVEKDG